MGITCCVALFNRPAILGFGLRLQSGSFLPGTMHSSLKPNKIIKVQECDARNGYKNSLSPAQKKSMIAIFFMGMIMYPAKAVVYKMGAYNQQYGG